MNREELLKAIERVKPGIAKNLTVEQSDFILFDEEYLASYNDEISISLPFTTGLRGGVKEAEFYKLLQKMAGKKFEMNLEGDQLQIKCGRTKAGFNFIREIQLPDLQLDGLDDSWQKLPEDFLEALSFCSFSAATDVSKGILTCLRVEGDTMLSCDDLRLTRYRMKEKIDSILNIPCSAATELIKYGPDEFAADIDGAWIHFRNREDLIFSTRTVVGEYPEVDEFFDVKGSELNLPKTLKDMLERSEIMTGSDSTDGDDVRITIADNWVKCRGEGSAGWVEEKAKVDYSGEKILFYVDPQFLTQIFDRTQAVVVSANKLLFTGDNFEHVIATVIGE